MKTQKPADPKPKYRYITDHAHLAALIKLGKWREDKPFWIRDYAEDGTTKALWLEVTAGTPGEAWSNGVLVV